MKRSTAHIGLRSSVPTHESNSATRAAKTNDRFSMKAKRIAARQGALDTAREHHNLNKILGLASEPVTSGSVFTPEQTDTECRRHRRILKAKLSVRNSALFA